jgi:hypothetical protein
MFWKRGLGKDPYRKKSGKDKSQKKEFGGSGKLLTPSHEDAEIIFREDFYLLVPLFSFNTVWKDEEIRI